MPQYALSPPTVNAVPIVGDERLFPVRRVYCVGRNYAAHAREMGIDPRAEEPFFFLKPADTVIGQSATGSVEVPYPPGTGDLQHEVELVVAIGREGSGIVPEDAVQHIWGYAVGVDMTRRDLQRAMRDSGKPWEIGKTFERSAPLGPLTPLSRCGELRSGAISLSVGLARRQSSDLSTMIWSVSEIIARLSQFFTLRPGDLLFTGTPAGVGPVVPGDVLTGAIDGLGELRVSIAKGARSPENITE